MRASPGAHGACPMKFLAVLGLWHVNTNKTHLHQAKILNITNIYGFPG